ncbi:SNARE domain protein [Aspergillus crustosus]
MSAQRTEAQDHQFFLDNLKSLSEDIDALARERETHLAAAQNAVLQSNNSTEDKTSKERLDRSQEEITAAYHALSDRFAKLKNTPGSGDTRVQSQFRFQGNRLKAEVESYQKSQKEFRGRLEEQVRRRAHIAYPDASQEDIDEAVRNVTSGTEQSFQVTGAKSKRARDVKNNVATRSEEFKKIEKLIVELAQLIDLLSQKIAEQEPAVQQIDQGAENVARDLENANTQLGQAVVSARKARRWKWYALIIIIIIIAIIVAVAVGVTQS